MPHVVSLTHPELAEAIAEKLDWSVLPVKVTKFASGESRLQILQPLSSSHVFVLHSTQKPVDENIVLYANLIEALRHIGAEKIETFFPWLGYSLQDRRFSERESQAFEVATQLLRASRVSSCWTLDVHSPETLPKNWNMLSAWPLFADDLKKKNLLEGAVFVSPDKGSEARVKAFALEISAPFFCLQKKRDQDGNITALQLSDEDSHFLQGKNVILMDDVINSGSTMIEASVVLKNAGVKRISVYATHGLLVGSAIERLSASDIDEVVVTDSISTAVHQKLKKLRIVTIAGLLLSQFQELA